MKRSDIQTSAGTLREIAIAFLKLGTTAYGGPAIMGIMQAELQEKKQWTSKSRFIEGISLVNMLPGVSILPAFERVRQLVWTKAAMKGIGPAVIGVLAVSLLQMAPHAAPDTFAIAVFAVSMAALVVWQIGPIKLMLVGAWTGMLRNRLLMPGP